MQWQRLLSAAAAIVGVAAVGCDSAPSLHAADLAYGAHRNEGWRVVRECTIWPPSVAF